MSSYFKTLDVVIPSYRFCNNAGHLVRIAGLSYPADWTVCIYVIGDHPTDAIPDLLQHGIDTGRIHFHRNEKNRGLNYSRNKGIDLSGGQWILLLDDDIVPDPRLLFAYTQAIEKHPEANGFAGVVRFPPPHNSFTSALEAAGYTFFFNRAQYNTTLPWGVGANIVFNREKLGDLRFSISFKNDEGGDEVDLAIRLRNRHHQNLVAVPMASVNHPWWNDGAVDYYRAFKYSRGDYRLLRLHPQYAVYRFCNNLELFFLLLVISPFLFMAGISVFSGLFFTLSLIPADFVLHVLRIRHEQRKLGAVSMVQTWLLKKAGQLGYATTCIRHFYFVGLLRRFDMELNDHPKHFHTNRWFWFALLAYAVTAFLAFWI